ncbi:HlyD family efflux transporter periplasmic adaptor subunit [Pedobacter aquatilis]|uniref:HlyD family secretion protein n=1 Tax=Pedobacter aquatilis TaxID=351343 RepID=UPI0025B5F832|nr:HlyD family efflux transporter periplasmic adaptor subunit [Pedobacter aquatilis]MDN3588843.1 HlyD family efflux transporter periplasmic adaptor subunit [Pedobacter aquatilis]
MDSEKYIFPKEVIENTAEYHFHSHNSRTKIIYQVLLVTLMVAFLSIFLIKVDVNVKSTGLFRPTAERNEIKPLVAGRVDSLFIKENMHVKAGQVLLTIKKENIESQDELNQFQQTDVEDQLYDLGLLINAYRRNDWSKKLPLKSGVYGQQYSYFMQRVSEAKARYQLALKNFERFAYLYKRKAVSAVEYDEVKLKKDNVFNELSLIGEEQGSKWQTELNQLRIQNQQLDTKDKQYTEEKEFYTIKAPLTGTVQELKGIQPGSSISANEILGEISPDSGLIAETYVQPKDIGLLKIGTKARFQIDAYNYNEWGMATGKIISISNDIFMQNGVQPFFKVRCLLDKNSLNLKNGYVGKIKKGMTLQARFFVTRRTLFQLLYDKADDWLNPNVIPDAKEIQTTSL